MWNNISPQKKTKGKGIQHGVRTQVGTQVTTQRLVKEPESSRGDDSSSFSPVQSARMSHFVQSQVLVKAASQEHCVVLRWGRDHQGVEDTRCQEGGGNEERWVEEQTTHLPPLGESAQQ